MNEMRIYVASLSDYNDGRLEGKWLDLSDYSDASELMEAIQEMLDEITKKYNDGEVREEWAVHDYEGIPSTLASEYMGEQDFQQLYDIAEVADDRGIPVEVLVERAGDTGSDDYQALADSLIMSVSGNDESDIVYEYENQIGELGFDWWSNHVGITKTDQRLLYGEDVDYFKDEILSENPDMDEDEAERQAEERADEEADERNSDLISYLQERGYENEFPNWVYKDYQSAWDELSYDFDVIHHDGNMYVFSNNYSLGGTILSGLIGAYIGYKIGRAKPQKKGFETEKKIGRKIKGAFSKKKMAKGGSVENKGYDVIVKLPSGLTTKKDFDGFSKQEIIKWCQERGWEYNEKAEKLGGRVLKNYEFFVTPIKTYSKQLPKNQMAKGGSTSESDGKKYFTIYRDEEGSVKTEFDNYSDALADYNEFASDDANIALYEVINGQNNLLKENESSADIEYVELSNGDIVVTLEKIDGKWEEGEVLDGEIPYGWGGKRYMGYLKPKDLAQWLNKDYGGYFEIVDQYAKGGSVGDAIYFAIVRNPSDKNYWKLGWSTTETSFRDTDGREYEKLYFAGSKNAKKYYLDDINYLTYLDEFTATSSTENGINFLLARELHNGYRYYIINLDDKSIFAESSNIDGIKQEIRRLTNGKNFYGKKGVNFGQGGGIELPTSPNQRKNKTYYQVIWDNGQSIEDVTFENKEDAENLFDSLVKQNFEPIHLSSNSFNQYGWLEKHNTYKMHPKFAKGGGIGFKALSNKVAKRYQGKPVAPKYQSQYGKTYSKSEAKEVGDKVAGKVYWQQQGRKMAKGGGVDLFSMSKLTNERGKISEMVIAENVSVEEFNKLFSDKGYRKVYDNTLVGFYFAKPNGDTIQLIPSFHKKGEIIKYAKGGGVAKYDYDYEDIGQFSVADSEWKNYSQEDFRRMGKKIVKEKYNGDLSRAYNSVVRKNKMERGGGVENNYNNPEKSTHVLHIDGQNWYLEKIDSTHFYMSNSPNYRGMAHHIGQHKGEPYYEEVREWLKSTFSEGGGVDSITPSLNKKVIERTKEIYRQKGGKSQMDFVLANNQAIEEFGYNPEKYHRKMNEIGAEFDESEYDPSEFAKGGGVGKKPTQSQLNKMTALDLMDAMKNDKQNYGLYKKQLLKLYPEAKGFEDGGGVGEFWVEINERTLNERLPYDLDVVNEDEDLISGNIWIKFRKSPMQMPSYELKRAISEDFEYFAYGNQEPPKRVSLMDGSWGSFYIEVENLTLNEIKTLLLELPEQVEERLEERKIKGYKDLGLDTYGQSLDLRISQSSYDDNYEYAKGGGISGLDDLLRG